MKYYKDETSIYAFADGTIIAGTTEISAEEYNAYMSTVPAVVVQVPQSITPRQIRKVLTDGGMRQAVETMVATSTDYDLKDWWEYSLDYQRTHPKLLEAAYALGLTDEQIDSMFILASSL